MKMVVYVSVLIVTVTSSILGVFSYRKFRVAREDLIKERYDRMTAEESLEKANNEINSMETELERVRNKSASLEKKLDQVNIVNSELKTRVEKANQELETMKVKMMQLQTIVDNQVLNNAIGER